MDNVKAVIRSNNLIKKRTKDCVKDFLTIQGDFIEKVKGIVGRLDTVKSVADIFLGDDRREVLENYQPLEEVHLAVCGYNSSGKTSFIHELLGLGDFLPASEGAVTARIVKFSYAPEAAACLIRYTSLNDSIENAERVDLSEPFTSKMKKKTRTDKLRKLIRIHLLRPEDIPKESDRFTQWAKTFIEIRVPAPILELGLHVYDTPGFLGSDSPVLRDNLLELVSSVHPTLVFLYDNATVSDDSRKCYEKLKEALRSEILGVDIFFLNTKADVSVIRKNARNCDDSNGGNNNNEAGDDDDDDEDDNDDDNAAILQKERLDRFNLLRDVDEMQGDIHYEEDSGRTPCLDQCDCFDIFSSLLPKDSMEKMMKRQAIDRIIRFAAISDLRLTKDVIATVQVAISAFFDFVLVTNRRSTDEWKQLRDEALEWGKNFSQVYRASADQIAAEANLRLPERFREKLNEIKEKACKDCEERGWRFDDTRNKTYSSSSFKTIRMFNLCAKDIFHAVTHWKRKPCTVVQTFIDMLVERDVIKPILQKITSKVSKGIEESMGKMFTTHIHYKNELLSAAYREVLIDTGDLGSLNRVSIGETISVWMRAIIVSPAILVIFGVAFALGAIFDISQREESDDFFRKQMRQRANDILTYLRDLEKSLSTLGTQIKTKMVEWIDDEHKKFRKKVIGYYEIACRTLKQRDNGYQLARQFAPQFAQIECCLEANINLAAHYGSSPVIDEQVILGTGGFFTVHPASWGNETLVAKKLRDHITNQDVAFLEAHFHRTITRLDIPHMAPLKYLYQGENSALYLLLPRYATDLHEFLKNNMKKITADKAVQISRNIASVIAHMHAHDLVHRDIKVQNILVDEAERVYLADFGTCQHGKENTTFIGSHPLPPDIAAIRLSSSESSNSTRQYSYEGTGVDVYLIGLLMYACAPKDNYIPLSDNTADNIHLLDRRRVPERYCQLITRCLDKQVKQRPAANEIIIELDAIAKQLCIVCEEAPRFARLVPCGHKVVCVGCLEKLRQKSTQMRCIICQQAVTDVMDDNDSTTFILLH